jgi:short-subunit dehydrogenase
MSFWTRQHCLVTGASSGLGRALAIALADRGAHVGLVARRASELEILANSLTGRGHKAAYAVADVTQVGPLRDAVRQLESSLGPCVVLLANAGIYRQTNGAAYDGDRAAAVFTTNIIGVSNSLAAVLPGMVARGRGHICAISSLGGFVSLPAAGAYCASKTALAVLMKSIRLDTASRGIHVTTAFPGFIDTPMITEGERHLLPKLVPADRAAAVILRAVERRRREVAFPFGTWLGCQIARLLPWPAYYWVMQHIPHLEEPSDANASSAATP